MKFIFLRDCNWCLDSINITNIKKGEILEINNNIIFNGLISSGDAEKYIEKKMVSDKLENKMDNSYSDNKKEEDDVLTQNITKNGKFTSFFSANKRASKN